VNEGAALLLSLIGDVVGVVLLLRIASVDRRERNEKDVGSR
jgi:hypothetical protein